MEDGFESKYKAPRVVAVAKLAIIPEMLAEPREKTDPHHWNSNNAPMLMWRPVDEEKLPEIELNQYLKYASDLKFNDEQALGVLLRCMYDVSLASRVLSRNIFHKSTEWSSSHKAQFRHAFNCYEKKFTQVNSIVTDKSHAELVNYYYLEWKKENRRPNKKNKEKELANDRGGCARKRKKYLTKVKNEISTVEKIETGKIL